MRRAFTPTLLVASKKRKKTEMESSDTMRTARSVWRCRTLEASSCTEMDTEMRFAMSTSSSKKADSPAALSSLFDLLNPSSLRSFSSTRSIFTDLGSAAKTTDSAITTATSSSSEIPASLAASSSSRAMPKDTEKARSEPSAPSALAASLMALPKDWEPGQVLLQHEIAAANCESHLLPAYLPWQHVGMVVRRLLAGPQALERARACGPARRRRHARESRLAEVECKGGIFGTALGNLLAHARASKHSRQRAMRALRDALVPVGAAVGSTSGDDRPHLVRGLASRRALPQQACKLRELQRAGPNDSRHGHHAVALGAAAALLVAHSIMALDPNDAPLLGAQLSCKLERLVLVFNAWRLDAAAGDEMRAALRAETRALERGLVGLEVARARSQHLTAAQSFRLQLLYYRRAAWPAGLHLDAQSHESVLHRLRHTDFLSQPDAPCTGVMPAGILPLSAIPDLCDSASETSSCSSASTLSSCGDWATGE